MRRRVRPERQCDGVLVRCLLVLQWFHGRAAGASHGGASAHKIDAELERMCRAYPAPADRHSGFDFCQDALPAVCCLAWSLVCLRQMVRTPVPAPLSKPAELSCQLGVVARCLGALLLQPAVGGVVAIQVRAQRLADSIDARVERVSPSKERTFADNLESTRASKRTARALTAAQLDMITREH